jgi:hypothetical protein
VNAAASSIKVVFNNILYFYPFRLPDVVVLLLVAILMGGTAAAAAEALMHLGELSKYCRNC